MFSHRLLLSLGRRPFSMTSLEEQVSTQKALFNQLRSSNAEPSYLEAAKKKLGELQKSLAQSKAATNASGDDGGKKRERLLLKTAKGTRDFGPAEMACRESIERTVKDCFKSFGGSCLDTPVFERKDILTGKYGEDAKLIFDLMDQGGEQLALRYDHTVPLARYLAMAGGTSAQSKIWQVGKVYRRDNPVMSKGRMREFSQADFDIHGSWDPMIPDAEIISLVCNVLTKLNVGEFTIKACYVPFVLESLRLTPSEQINHRKILDGIFEVCGVPAEKIRSISSAVDKLDKSPWSEVKKEMTADKGLDEAVADEIGEYVKLKGGPALIDQLSADPRLANNASAQQGLADMTLLFSFLKAYDVVDKLSFDLSLARGLDYYTGVIYEAVVAASAPPSFDASTTTPKPKKNKANPDEEEEIDESQVGVGSIAAGGRYDNLVGMFTAAAAAEGKKAPSIPCIGISFGLDRIFALLWPTWVERGGRTKETVAYVMSAGDGLLEERIKLVKELREGGIQADFLAKSKPKVKPQFDAVEADEVPFAIIIGVDEVKRGEVKVKQQTWMFVDGQKKKVENKDDGKVILRSELITWLKRTMETQ
ncbi:Histidyl-tRNA synthetase [Mycena indigotica]|uniref:histidine--tRNA ligase n=1 Tax=Mycena indigotica TaxID=2126181 RepID=A0A8H6W305_9AGAR|nr:Histidyl-tRNA synthetase [Mycena indigotica]KAF7303734.1 Histidyl-tRNA synthetase [Mycena indigotica]